MTTWNTGSSKCDKFDQTENWLKNLEKYDLIVIGLQECSLKKCNSTKWKKRLVHVVTQHDFCVVSSIMMWEMLLVVFIRVRYKNYVQNIQKKAVATGVMDVVGNKGGLMISFSFQKTRFMFITSHLAAQVPKFAERNKHFYKLLSANGLRVENKNWEPTFCNDYLFWMGDLNYRVDHNFQKIVELVENNQLDEVKKYDQFQHQRK